MKIFFKNIFSIKPDSSSAKRIELIDFLRGGAMLLVLLNHSSFPKGHYVLAFHMPLFFIISGYVGHISGGYKKDFFTYVKNRFFRLIIPYFLFELLNIILWFINCTFFSSLDFSLKDCLISVATCVNNNYVGFSGRLWFLPCIFVADIYTKIILSYRTEKKIWLLTAILLFFGISYLITSFCPCRLPMTIDTAFMAAAFILIGHLICDFITDITEDKNIFLKILLAAILLLFEVYALKHGNVSMLMYTNAYGEYVVTIFAALCGSISFICIASTIYQVTKKTVFLKNIVCWYGINSLASFPIHEIVLFILRRLGPFDWYLLFLFTVIINIPIVNFITHYAPFMLGRKFAKK